MSRSRSSTRSSPTRGITAETRSGNSPTSASAPTSANRIAHRRAGSISAPNATRCTRIGDGFRASAVNGCCEHAANCWNVRTRTCTTRAACGARTCAVTTTSSSDCSCMRAPAIWGCGCGRSAALGTPRGLQGRVGRPDRGIIVGVESKHPLVSPPYSTDDPITCLRSRSHVGPSDLGGAAENGHLYHGLLEAGVEYVPGPATIVAPAGLLSQHPADSDTLLLALQGKGISVCLPAISVALDTEV